MRDISVNEMRLILQYAYTDSAPALDNLEMKPLMKVFFYYFLIYRWLGVWKTKNKSIKITDAVFEKDKTKHARNIVYIPWYENYIKYQ